MFNLLCTYNLCISINAKSYKINNSSCKPVPVMIWNFITLFYIFAKKLFSSCTVKFRIADFYFVIKPSVICRIFNISNNFLLASTYYHNLIFSPLSSTFLNVTSVSALAPALLKRSAICSLSSAFCSSE